MKNHTCFSSLIALILSLSSFQTKAQHLDLFNDPHLDSTLIKQFGIKSLIVYSDYAEEGFEESNFSITSKWKEIAFNEEGQQTYVRTVPLFGAFGYLGVSDVKWHFFTYDSLHRTDYIREKTEDFDNEGYYTYNKEGRIIKLITFKKGEPHDTTTFNWQDDELIDHKSSIVDTVPFNIHYSYGSDGNLNRIEYSNVRYDYETKKMGRITEQTMKGYQDGKLTAQRIVRTNSIRKRLEYFISLDQKNDTLKEMRAKFDQHHNIIFFHSKDFSNRNYHQEYILAPASSDDKKYPSTKNPIPEPLQTIYEIENFYDDRGLLIKQKYVEVDPRDPKKKKVISIQRFIYETDELLIQPLPIEEEETYEYEGDY